VDKNTIPWTRTIVIAICAITVSTGCFLDRRPRPQWNSLGADGFCPGDTITAGFDFLGMEECPYTDGNCERFMPNVSIGNVPEIGASEIFPAQTLTSFRSSYSFTAPDVEQITVKFHSDRNKVQIPVRRNNEPGFVERPDITDTTRTVYKLDTTSPRPLSHLGMCAAGVPTYGAAVIPSPPHISPNAKLKEVCNGNTVPVQVTLSGSAPGEQYTFSLMVDQCQRLDAPGTPAFAQSSKNISLKPESIPADACAAGNAPPTPLRTFIKLGCN
jgi:hypothetical protein